ncbi:MAG TPA: hypothetical protein VMJ10_05290 [Kofleriaceae bacterium]|nr:hypothetical protein [Kofleriaceae bacterium]
MGRPNLHVGVVNTTVDQGIVGDSFGPQCPSPDPGDNGLMQKGGESCSAFSIEGSFISDISDGMGGRTVNYSGQLTDAFACVAQVGDLGCGFEAPLEAMKRALDGTEPQNAGFLRDDAYLAIVILTDEDDASIADPSIFTLPEDSVGGLSDFRAQPMFAYTCDRPITTDVPATYTNCRVRTGSYLTDPASYPQFLATIKDPSQTVVAVIAGDPETTIQVGSLMIPGQPESQSPALMPSCTATINGVPDIARPGIRLDSFRAAYADYGHGVFETVCQSDYSDALAQIGNTLFAMMSPCLEGNIDTTDREAENPGLQPDCTVELRVGLEPNVTSTSLPACTMIDATTPDPSGPQPCWWVQPAAACMTTTGLELETQGVPSPLPQGMVISATCTKAMM